MFDKALKNVTGLDGKHEDVRFIQLYGQAEMLAVVERIQHIGGNLKKYTNFTIAIPRNKDGIDFDKFVENVSEAIRRYDLQYGRWFWDGYIDD